MRSYQRGIHESESYLWTHYRDRLPDAMSAPQLSFRLQMWATHSEGQEQSVQDGKAGDMVGDQPVLHQQQQLRAIAAASQVVDARQEEAKDSLHAQPEDHGVLGSEVVDDECAGERARLYKFSAQSSCSRMRGLDSRRRTR